MVYGRGSCSGALTSGRTGGPRRRELSRRIQYVKCIPLRAGTHRLRSATEFEMVTGTKGDLNRKKCRGSSRQPGSLPAILGGSAGYQGMSLRRGDRCVGGTEGHKFLGPSLN
jgi:hypothetical protein